MKRVVVLLLAMGLLASCATVPKTPLALNDAASLTGTWEGVREMIWGRYRSFDPAVLEIQNSTVPLKGVLTISMVEGRYPISYPFENGVIDPSGNLLLQLRPDVKVILSHYNEGGKLKLTGYYEYVNNVGTLTVYKK